MKICHVSLGSFPDKKDGSAKLQRGIFDELKKRGHDITLLTAKWGEGFNDPDIKAIDIPRTRFMWLPKFLLKIRSYLLKNEFDVIQGNGSRGSLPIILSKKPYLTFIHDVGPFQAKFTKIPVLKWLEKKNAKASKMILCNSESTRHEISKYMKVPLDKIHIVSSAIDPIFKSMPDKADKLKERLKISGPVLLYIGRIAFYKGIGDIIQAYKSAKKEIPDLNLIIGGIPTLKMQKTVEKWKTDNPDVIFYGMIPDEEMPIFYSMADIFITYSYASEGFGLTSVESLACETPVICSSLPAYKEILQQFATFVEPKKPDLLSTAILQHLKNPSKFKEIVNSSKDLLKQYTWKEVVDLIESVYEDYLQQSMG